MTKGWQFLRETRTILALATLNGALLGACSSDPDRQANAAATAGAWPLASGGNGGTALSTQGGMPNAMAGTAGTAGAASGASTSSISGGGAGVAGTPVSAGSGGLVAGAGGSAGVATSGAAAGGMSPGGGAGGWVTGGGPAVDCNWSTPVSFQKDIQGFLGKSCGKGVNSGCHVTDANKTSLGYNHAYDWITAVAHTGSCGKTPPYAKRFEVVLAVINGAKPASCPNSRKMPPADAGATPLTTCDVAALQAWLAEPKVVQMHVPVSDETAALYPSGPYAMPPFN